MYENCILFGINWGIGTHNLSRYRDWKLYNQLMRYCISLNFGIFLVYKGNYLGIGS